MFNLSNLIFEKVKKNSWDCTQSLFLSSNLKYFQVRVESWIFQSIQSRVGHKLLSFGFHIYVTYSGLPKVEFNIFLVIWAYVISYTSMTWIEKYFRTPKQVWNWRNLRGCEPFHSESFTLLEYTFCSRRGGGGDAIVWIHHQGRNRVKLESL